MNIKLGPLNPGDIKNESDQIPPMHCVDIWLLELISLTTTGKSFSEQVPFRATLESVPGILVGDTRVTVGATVSLKILIFFVAILFFELSKASTEMKLSPSTKALAGISFAYVRFSHLNSKLVGAVIVKFVLFSHRPFNSMTEFTDAELIVDKLDSMVRDSSGEFKKPKPSSGDILVQPDVNVRTVKYKKMVFPLTFIYDRALIQVFTNRVIPPMT